VPPLAWSDAARPLPPGHRINTYEHLMTRVDARAVDALVAANRDSLKPAPEAHSPQRHAQQQENRVEKDTPAAAAASTTTEAPAAIAAPAPGADGAFVPAPVAPTISIDDFMKIDLRVARVVEATHVEGAEKLIRLTLDIGSEQRQVFAGIKAHYDPAAIVGRLVVMVANLQPRKMRFGESQGMVLAASGEDTGVFLLDADSGALPGMRAK
jgi:methionyl-tRNA synthetase